MDCTPEVRSVELNPGDNAIVLATDGLWDVLSDAAVVELLLMVRHCSGLATPANTVRWPDPICGIGHAYRPDICGVPAHNFDSAAVQMARFAHLQTADWWLLGDSACRCGQ